MVYARRAKCFFIVGTIALSAAMGCLVGCGGNSSGNGITPAPLTPGLAVADSGNNRILFYNTPSSTNESSGVVLGQANFTQGSANQGGIGPGANSLYGPAGLAKDSSGNLYVADTSNCRVLEFKAPFTNGMNASLVIGQPVFTTASCQSTASGLEGPTGEVLDSQGNLWVVDGGSSRVLEYVRPFSNGMAASTVLGQMDFTSWLQNQNPGGGLAGLAANTLFSPLGLTFDGSGNLNVADTGNQRILVFAPPFSNGMNATSVLGQTNFTLQRANQDASSPAANTLRGPSAVLALR